MFLFSKFAMPNLAAIKIVCVKAGRAEPGDHALAIRHRRCGAIRIIVVGQFIFASVDSGLPKPLASGFVEAHESASRAGGFTGRAGSLAAKRLSDEHAIPDRKSTR